MTTNSKDYNKKYWLANRKKLLIERAERYKHDKAYREAVIARARAANALQKLMRSLEKERAEKNAKESGSASNSIRSEKRRRVSKEGKDKVVRQGTSDDSGQHGYDSEYGELSKPKTRRGSSSSMLTCGGRKSLR